jgi:hypothetical protein
MIWANGDVFDGCCSNGLRHGFGVYRYANGDVYIGNWEKDQKDGRGIMIWANGDVFDGFWSNGLIIHGSAWNLSLGLLIGVEKINQYSEVTHNNKNNKKQDAFSANKVKKRSSVWAFFKTVKAVICNLASGKLFDL